MGETCTERGFFKEKNNCKVQCKPQNKVNMKLKLPKPLQHLHEIIFDLLKEKVKGSYYGNLILWIRKILFTREFNFAD